MRKRKGGRGTLFCFPLFRHWCVPKRAEKRGGKFIRRAIFIVAVQFFWKKGKKGKKGWANLLEVTSFFFNSISRGRRCELTLSFRTVVNIFVRRESIEKNNVSFLYFFIFSLTCRFSRWKGSGSSRKIAVALDPLSFKPN